MIGTPTHVGTGHLPQRRVTLRRARLLAASIGTAILMMISFTSTSTSAYAFTWMNKVCIGFAACNQGGYGNAGYENEYLSSHWGMTGGHNCTNYTAYRLIKAGVNASYLAGQGMAWQWGGVAQAHGVVVDGNARVGDIAWFAASTANQVPDGHVAYVESVNAGAGTIRVSEDNWGGNFDWRDYHIADVSGFIHFGGTPATSGNPFGSFDELSTAPGLVTVRGWAADPNNVNGPLAVHVYANGTMLGQIIADRSRPDVHNAMPAYGSNLGYEATLAVHATGAVQVCTYAINQGSGDTNTQLGCKTVNVGNPNPCGSLDVASGGPGIVSVGGWSLDPNSLTTATGIHMYVGGPAGNPNAQWFDLGLANGARSDIASTFPGAGPNHGFGKTVATDHRGVQTVYVYALNAAGPGDNVLLGSKTVTIGYLSGQMTATPTPTISGTATVDHKLTAKPGTWKPAGVTLSYQWTRNGAAIQGATASTYTLRGADYKKVIRVTVTGSKLDYRTVPKTSKATRKVHIGKIHAGLLTLSGTATVGSVLEVGHSGWSREAGFYYQWFRGSSKIAAAPHGSLYTLTAADLGKRIRCKVTGLQTGYKSTSKYTAWTSTVK
jgi:surface antigen